jgi:2-keto-3-deoxy-L-rhamnonate aldolase RhmA
MMKTNKLRAILNGNGFSVATRVENTYPLMTELIGSTGFYDYIEYVAEYTPYTQYDLENIARAAELNSLSTMIKLDFQNRFYTAQRAMGAGFQAILFSDHKTAGEVRESLYHIKPDTPEDGGRFGYPNRRWIGYQPHVPQVQYANMVRDTVVAVMIEKGDAVDNIEDICSVPGVDMVQFGPSDYSLSRGWNMAEHLDDCKAAERRVIKAALAHGVHPRCEIQSPAGARYYLDLGVRHFCIGDELANALRMWTEQGGGLREMLNTRG